MTPISSKRIAVFPGTFDPFTLGHMSIVSRGLELLDEVVIAIGINDSKRTYFTVEQRIILGFESFRTTASPSTLRSNGMPGLFCGVSGR